jgi:DNA-3-methyladenine glycosylase II
MNTQLVISPLVIDILTDPIIHNRLIEMDPSLTVIFSQVNSKSFKGLPKPPYVSLIGAVIGQIIRYSQAKQVRSKLYSLCGTDFDIGIITKLDSNHWDYIGLGPDKVIIINNLNNYIIKNKIILNKNGIEKLKAVSGIGDWTIDTTILTSFLDWDIFPVGDLFIRKKIQKLYKLPKVPTISQTRKISDKWKPYRSVVAWYLWRWFN